MYIVHCHSLLFIVKGKSPKTHPFTAARGQQILIMRQFLASIRVRAPVYTHKYRLRLCVYIEILVITS